MAYRSAKQDWTVGSVVKVGFLQLIVLAKVATPGNHLPDQYALRNERGVYFKFIPHNGLTRCANLQQAMEW